MLQVRWNLGDVCVFCTDSRVSCIASRKAFASPAKALPSKTADILDRTVLVFDRKLALCLLRSKHRRWPNQSVQITLTHTATVRHMVLWKPDWQQSEGISEVTCCVADRVQPHKTLTFSSSSSLISEYSVTVRQGGDAGFLAEPLLSERIMLKLTSALLGRREPLAGTTTSSV